MTVLSKQSPSMLVVMLNWGVKKITSVFSALLLSIFWVFHHITSSMQVWRTVRDEAWFAGSIAMYKCHRYKTKTWGYGEQSHPAEGQYAGWRVADQVWTLVFPPESHGQWCQRSLIDQGVLTQHIDGGQSFSKCRSSDWAGSFPRRRLQSGSQVVRLWCFSITAKEGNIIQRSVVLKNLLFKIILF